ncbi:MAG: arylamine N-acetyltransferase [Verrucomicrobiota bacterium]
MATRPHSPSLPQELLEQVLAKLGFQQLPATSAADLADLYAAWCQKVPFDNVRKMIHLHSGNSGELPGSQSDDFFKAWLAHGTGGTCWAGAGALHALLSSLGYDCQRGVATMLVAPELPPNHATVRVTVGGTNYLMDSSILCGEPLRLDEENETIISHPAWGLTCSQRDGRWHIAWRPLHKTDGFECRIEHFDVEEQDFLTNHEATRPWSPFNYELTARLNRGDEVIGAAFGHAVTFGSDGTVTRAPISTEERNRLLIEGIGLSEEIVSQLPADRPTPPPPGSRAAAAAQAAG